MKNKRSPQFPLFSAGQASLLARLFLRDGAACSLVELERATGLSAGAVHQQVERLERAGLLSSQRVGRTRLVRPNVASPFYPELRGLVIKALGPVPLLGEALGELPGVHEAFIYGSWAALVLGAGERAPRDVDVMIVGSPDLDRVDEACRRVEQAIGLPVNATVLSRAEWENDENGFVQAVKAGPRVPLIGETSA